MKLLTLARDLKRRKAREKHQLFVAEGVRAVEELLRSPLAVRGVIIAPQLREAPRGAALAADVTQRGVDFQEVDAHEFGSAAETESPQGILAIGVVPQRSLSDLPNDWGGVVLVLDALQDPGNVGTILRTAAGLGVIATLALPGTVDLWNAKVVRSGMGAHFRHRAFAVSWSELDELRRRAPMQVLAADASGEDVGHITSQPRVALVVGNEGAGLSQDARARADRTIALPLSGDVESLNVAVATGILLYMLTR